MTQLSLITLTVATQQVGELLSAFPIGNLFDSGVVHSAHLRVSSAASVATGEIGPMIGKNKKQAEQVLCALLIGIGKPEYICEQMFTEHGIGVASSKHKDYPQDKDMVLVRLAQMPPEEQAAVMVEMPHEEQATVLVEMPPEEQAAVMVEMPPEEQATVLEEMPPEEQAAVMVEMPLEEQAAVMVEMPLEEQAAVMVEMPLEEQATVLEEMPPEELAVALAEMPPEEQAALLLEMPPEKLAAALAEMLPKRQATVRTCIGQIDFWSVCAHKTRSGVARSVKPASLRLIQLPH